MLGLGPPGWPLVATLGALKLALVAWALDDETETRPKIVSFVEGYLL